MPTFDNANDHPGTSDSTISVSLTIGSLTSGILLIAVSKDDLLHAGFGTGTPTVGNSSTGVTSIANVTDASGDNRVRLEWWFLLNPPSGAQTIAVTNSTTLDGLGIAGVTYSGVDQTTPLGTAVTSGNFGSPFTLDVATSAGQLVVDALTWFSQLAAHTVTVGGSQTQRLNDASGNAGIGASEQTAGGATTTMSWTPDASNYWAQAAAVLNAAATGPTTPQIMAAVSSHVASGGMYGRRWR